MSSIQAYKAHKQEGTLVSMGHSAHLPKHPYISGGMIIVGYARGSHIEKLQTRGQKVGGWVRGKFSKKVTLCKI